ncbi:MAG: AAA family ATPase [Bacillota bacterium]|nr:AAA family ATPase [Bacillota bacterium]
MGKVVLIASGKGGVGKTTVATNLGVALAKQGSKTLILDMNVGLRNDDIYLGLENSILFDFGDVISGVCKLDKAIIRHDLCNNLYLLSGPQYREIDGLSASHIRTIYARLKKEFDVVLVDCPVVTGVSLVNLTSGADEAIIVVTPDFISVRNGDAINKKLAALGVFERCHVINMIQQETYDSEDLPDMLFVAKSLESNCIGVIPYDTSINVSNNQGKPIALDNQSYLAKTFDDMAKHLKFEA